MKGAEIAEALNARKIPGVRFEGRTFAVAEDGNRYPFHGRTIEGVRMVTTDRVALDSPRVGLEALVVLRKLYPEQFEWRTASRLVVNAATMAAIERGDDAKVIADGWKAGLEAFRVRRAGYLLYP